MARRARRGSFRRSRSTFTRRRSSTRTRSTGRRSNRVEIVVRQEPAQPIAAMPQFVQDGGKLKMLDPNGPSRGKF